MDMDMKMLKSFIIRWIANNTPPIMHWITAQLKNIQRKSKLGLKNIKHVHLMTDLLIEKKKFYSF